jgi:hypothetical protein
LTVPWSWLTIGVLHRKRNAMKLLVAVIALIVIAGLLVPTRVQAGRERAQHLNQCVSTMAEWDSASLGAELPFAGVRFYSKDGQRGHSATYCITARKARFEDEIHCDNGECVTFQDADPEGSTHPQREWPESYVRFPPRLRRNVESMRLAAPPGCFLTVWLRGLETKHPFSRSTYGWDSPWADGIVKHHRGIPGRYDDKAKWWGAHVVCGGAKLED